MVHRGIHRGERERHNRGRCNELVVYERQRYPTITYPKRMSIPSRCFDHPDGIQQRHQHELLHASSHSRANVRVFETSMS